jgi:hypothetical protein
MSDPRQQQQPRQDSDAVSMNEYISLLDSLRMRGADIPEMRTPEDVIAFAREKGLLGSQE